MGCSCWPGPASDGPLGFQPQEKVRRKPPQARGCATIDSSDCNKIGELHVSSQTECPLRAQHFKKEIWVGGNEGLAWVEILAYEPDLSGPSSPQRCSQPTVMHVPKRYRPAQWAIRIIIMSPRVLVPGL